MSASICSDNEWELIDSLFGTKLHAPNLSIDRNGFYASVCQLTGIPSETLRAMVSIAIKDLSNPFVHDTLTLIQCRFCLEPATDNIILKQFFEVAMHSRGIRDLRHIGDTVLSKRYCGVSYIEVQLIRSMMEELGYFVYFAQPSSQPSIDTKDLAETLKFYVTSPDTKVIMMGLNTSCDQYMFFTMEPCSSERGSMFSKMSGLVSSALAIAQKPSGILTPQASQLDNAFNLNVY